MLRTVLNVTFVCVALPVLLLAPGAVLWGALAGRYERLRRWAAETLGPWTVTVVQVAASMLVTGWVGFVLGEVGVFSRTWLVAVVAALSVAGLLAARLRPRDLLRSRRRTPARGAAAARKSVRRLSDVKGLINELVLRSEWFYAPVILVVAAFLFASPMRTLWRGHDGGRHLACGIALAERGSFSLDDPIGPSLSPDGARGTGSATTRLSGDYRARPHDRAIIYPTFLHFGATWVGIGYVLLGRWGALHATAGIALVGVGVFFVFVRAIASVKVALLTTVLLVLNFAQSYFVRASSPAVAQLLAWTAFLFFVLFVRLEIKPFGILAGVALGQLVLTGQHLYPALLVGWLVFVCSTYPRYHPKKLYRFIVFPFLVFVFQPALFDTFVGTYYTRNLARGLVEALVPGAGGAWMAHLPIAVARLGGLVGIAVFAVIAYRSVYRRNERFRDAVRRALAWRDGLAPRLAGVLAAVAYVVVFAARHAPYAVEADVVVRHGKWFYQFLDELGFGFFLLGVGLFIYFSVVRKRQPGLTFPFAVFFVFWLTAMWNPQTSGTLMHGAERLVPLYLPFAYVFVAYSLFALREVSGRFILGEAVKVLVVILAVVLPAVTAREQQVIEPWKRHEPGRDILAQYDEFFRTEPFPRNAIVFYERSLAPTQVPLVMQTVYRVDSVVLDGDRADPAEAGRVAHRLAQTGRPIFCAHEADGPSSVPAGFVRGPELPFDITTSILEEKTGSRPRAVVAAGSHLVFVQLEPEVAERPDDQP